MNRNFHVDIYIKILIPFPEFKCSHFKKVPLSFSTSFLSSSRTGQSNEMDGWLNEYNNNFMFHFVRMPLFLLLVVALWRPFYCNLCLTWWWNWILMGYESGWIQTDKRFLFKAVDWFWFFCRLLHRWCRLFTYLMKIFASLMKIFASLMQIFASLMQTFASLMQIFKKIPNPNIILFLNRLSITSKFNTNPNSN